MNLSWLHFLKNSYALYCVLILHVASIWAPANKAVIWTTRAAPDIAFLTNARSVKVGEVNDSNYRFEWGLLNKFESGMKGLREFFFFPFGRNFEANEKRGLKFLYCYFSQERIHKNQTTNHWLSCDLCYKTSSQSLIPHKVLYVWWINKWNLTIHTILYPSC